MVFEEYISKLFDFHPVIIGCVERYFLQEISRGDSNSAYKMFKHLQVEPSRELGSNRFRLWLEPAHHPMAYKNVYNRFRRLQELNLIYEIEGSSIRNAQYFRLTFSGWMNLIPTYEHYSISPIFTNVKDNPVLTGLVLPFFEERTFDKIFMAPLFREQVSLYLKSSISVTAELMGYYRKRLSAFGVSISREELKYYFGLISNPKYVNEPLDKRNEISSIRRQIKRFEDKYPVDPDPEFDSSIAIFPVSALQEKLKTNIKNLVIGLLGSLLKSDNRDGTEYRLTKDKKFRDLAFSVKKEFLEGCELLNLK